jgi:hypothetical protein
MNALENRYVSVPELLRQAIALIPSDARTDGALSVADADDYLTQHNEWELALDVMADFDGLTWQSVRYWDLLAEAAQQMRLDRAAAWCHWRGYETRHGIIRADLQLLGADLGGRQIPIPGPGVLRPMWDLGEHTDTDSGLLVARIWVESMPELPPGEHGPIRLAPLTPERWQRLAPGHQITMHEKRPTAGTATITQVLKPHPPKLQI